LGYATAVAARDHAKRMLHEHIQKKKESSNARHTARELNKVMERASAAMKDAELNATRASCSVLAAETAERLADIAYKRALELRFEAEKTSLWRRFERGAARVVVVLGADGAVPSVSQLDEVERIGCLRGEKQHYLDVMSEELESNMVYADLHKFLSREWGFFEDPAPDHARMDMVLIPDEEETRAGSGKGCDCQNQMCDCNGQMCVESHSGSVDGCEGQVCEDSQIGIVCGCYNQPCNCEGQQAPEESQGESGCCCQNQMCNCRGQVFEESQGESGCCCQNQMCNCRGQVFEESQMQSIVSVVVCGDADDAGDAGKDAVDDAVDDAEDAVDDAVDAVEDAVVCAQPECVADSQHVSNGLSTDSGAVDPAAAVGTDNGFVVQKHSQNLSMVPCADVGLCFYCKRMITQDVAHCIIPHVCAGKGKCPYCKDMIMVDAPEYTRKHVCHAHCDYDYWRERLLKNTDKGKTQRFRRAFEVAKANVRAEEKQALKSLYKSMGVH